MLFIKDLHKSKDIELKEYVFKGWVKTHRESKNVSFIELTDGSSVKGLQLVINPELSSYKEIAEKIGTGASIEVRGDLKESPSKGQNYELEVKEITLIGQACKATYPLQKKGHTLEFLREIQHLRARSNTLGAVFRVRSKASVAIHTFFSERDFYYIHTPIITSSDCEGAGEVFSVTTLNLDDLPKDDKGKVDYTKDFFKKHVGLTVSGQLQAEAMATALGRVYTFGPTFRAENSNTVRHLSEFWMVEPEMAFCTLEDNIKVAQEFIKYIIKYLLDNSLEDLEFLHSLSWAPKGLMDTLKHVVNSKSEVMTYTKAIEILEKSSKKFEYPVHWGIDLQSEHERYLTEEHLKCPVFLIDYPKEIKAFYMKLNKDNKTVKAMDLLVPGLGEIVGGSEREENYDVLLGRINELGLRKEDYSWYLDLRKYGSVPHSGFGLGLERFIMYITGIQNIRDVILFPRAPGQIFG
ncbi:MAG: asparagine--tRNA ligase [Bdellovibrionota bacterium]